ncbi:peroxisomal membrane protein 11A-like [Monodon monoceros]|uniref:peroxisomal membrane protein 11A-like n=1 Tax=Monodon monoceros TaxID=40151 RepID=UPI0010F61C23|nr:peroxisomal membrane protein 11A-like [Monodon monoceros]
MWAARHYYYSLLLSLVRDLYEISLQMEQFAHDRAKREKSPSQDRLGYSVANEETEWLQFFLLLLFRSLKKHLPLLLDTVKNFCDILNPLDQLGIYKSNPCIIGLGGLVSSIAGIITVAYPQMKLKTHWGGFGLKNSTCFQDNLLVKWTFALGTAMSCCAYGLIHMSAE